jgi:hypothetical protein
MSTRIPILNMYNMRGIVVHTCNPRRQEDLSLRKPGLHRELSKKKKYTINIGEGVEKLVPSCTVVEMSKILAVPQKVKHRFALGPTIPVLGTYPRETKTFAHTTHVCRCSEQLSS